MKRLISAITVNEAKKSGKLEIIIGGKSTIITDEARDLAKKYGIKFVESATIPAQDTQEFDRNTIKLIVEKTLERLPPEKRDMNAVTEAVLKVLNNYNK
ncbi:MAG: hypothetical protein JW956_06925 [Calditrichaceae bacterium]|nr:hypothetical protein [Calditrichaceae bacterium]